MQWNSEHFRVNSKEHCVIGRRNLKLGNIVTANSVYGKIRDKWEVRKVCLFIQNLLERRGVKDVVESTRFDLKFRKRHVLIKRRQGLIWSSGNGMFWLKGGNTFYRQSGGEACWWKPLSSTWSGKQVQNPDCTGKLAIQIASTWMKINKVACLLMFQHTKSSKCLIRSLDTRVNQIEGTYYCQAILNADIR